MSSRRDANRLPLVALAVVMVVAIAGVVLPWLVGDRSRSQLPAEAVPIGPAAAEPEAVHVEPHATDGGPRPAGEMGEVSVASPTSTSWGVPVGYPQSPAGVRAAAVGWVAALGDLMQMGPIARQDTLAALVSTGALGDTVESFRTERDRFRSEFGRDPSQLVWLDVPLSVAISSATDQRAVVEVWSALHFGTVTERIEVMWRIHTITLVWERDSWRVDDVARREGPTPVVVSNVLASHGSEFVEVTGWRPAVLAGTSVG